MTRFLRGGIAAVAAGGVALAIASAAWPEDGADAHVGHVFCPADARDPERQARAAAVAARIAAKDALMVAVVHGDLRLVDAVNRIIALNCTWPQIWPFEYDFRRGRSLQERIAGVVIETAAMQIEVPSLRASVTARLERELAAAVRDGLFPIDDPALPPALSTPETVTATTARAAW